MSNSSEQTTTIKSSNSELLEEAFSINLNNANISLHNSIEPDLENFLVHLELLNQAYKEHYQLVKVKINVSTKEKHDS